MQYGTRRNAHACRWTPQFDAIGVQYMNFRGGSVALLLIGVVALAAPRMPEAQTLTVLYTFTGEADGGVPSGGLVRDEAGNLYGATTYGGVTNCSLGCGVIFKIDSNGKET